MSIRCTVLLATLLLIGVLYVFTTYAVDVAYGPEGLRRVRQPDRKRVLGRPGALALRALLVLRVPGHRQLTIANANAGVNVSTRTAYAMGRIGAFPRFLAIVSPRHTSPVYSVLVAFVITVAVTLALGLMYNPTVAFAMVGTGLVIVIVAIYILMRAACIGYFARRQGGFNWLSHLIIPCSVSPPSSRPG